MEEDDFSSKTEDLIEKNKIEQLKTAFLENFNEIYVKIKDSPNFKAYVLIGVLGVFFITGILHFTFTSNGQPSQTQNQNAFVQEKMLPDSFLNPFPEPLVKEKIVEVIREVPAPAKEFSDPFKLFKIREGREPTPSEEETLRHDVQEIRRTSSIIYVAPKDKNPDYKSNNISQDTSTDEDYKKQDIDKLFASYPVNLDRALTEDRFIPAVLITKINSELASDKVLAQIESDVYSSHGRHILIPKGSKAIGEYKPLKTSGDTRLQVNWRRIITPNGINIKIKTETADQAGSSGSGGEVDNRVKDKYGTALLFSTISAMAQLSVKTQNTNQAKAADAFGGEFGTITAELLRNSLDITPRMTIAKGTRFNISPLTDLWFKEPTTTETEIISLKEYQQ